VVEEEVEEEEIPLPPQFIRERELIGAAGAALIKVNRSKSLRRIEQPPATDVGVWRGAEVVAYGDDKMNFWEELLEKDPRDAYAHRRLGRALEANGQRGKAMGHYRDALAIDQEYNYAKRDLGVALAAEGERSEAVKLLQEVLQSDPNYSQVYCDLGDVLAAESDWDGALWHYQCALSRNVDYRSTTSVPVLGASYKLSALRGIGIVLCSSGQREAGIVKLHQALELCPEDQLTQYHLAVATGTEDTVVTKDPWKYNSESGMRTGHLLQASMATRPVDMAELYRKASKKNPDDKLAMLRLGAALYCAQDSAHGHSGDLL